MLRLPRFRYLSPRTLADAAAMLRDEDRAMLLAGGTDVFPKMKRRQMMPASLISLGRVEDLTVVGAGFSRPSHECHIGAMTTLTSLETDAAFGPGSPYTALVQAARSISTPQLRETGTIGGNLCLDTRCNWYDQSASWRAAEGYCMKTHPDVVCRVATSSPRCLAVASADTVPALLVLDARVHVINTGGERDIALADMYQEDGIHYTTLQQGDILTTVSLPRRDGWRSTYLKLRDRQAFDFPIAAVAAAVRVDPNHHNIVADARIAITAFGSRAELLPEASAVLIGRKLDDDAIAEAAALVFKAARPMDNTAGTMHQRKINARVLTARALKALSSQTP